MYITIGIIGPEESVKKFAFIGKEFPHITFTPFIYQHVTEVDQLIEKGKSFVDQWLFTGIMNYSYAQSKQLIQKNNATYPKLHGSSFFGKLLEIQHKEKQLYHSFSIDNMTQDELQKFISLYDLTDIQFQTIPFTTYDSTEKLITFHRTLHHKQEADIALTTIRAVYDALQQEGVPVYHIHPSYLSIRNAIEHLVHQAEKNHYENLQLAVIGCKIFSVEKYIQQSLIDWKQKELQIKGNLLELTQAVNGSFIEVADGLYFIFTTKGDITVEMEQSLFECIQRQQNGVAMDLGFAIGYGDTVTLAEQHVRYGLNLLQLKQENPAIHIVFSEENVVLKTATNKKEILQTNALHDFLQVKYAHDAVNVRDIIRIANYAHTYHQATFHAENVATWLGSTTRNARRILNDLAEAHIIEVAKKVQLGARGRPTNIYQFTSEYLDVQKQYIETIM